MPWSPTPRPGRTRSRLAEAGADDVDVDMAERMNDLLLPIVKGVGSERSYEMLAQSLQTLGGSGFLQDYPIEQYIRDAKIDTLYEGTTAIQGLDFFFRKMVRDQFKAVFHLAAADHRDRQGRRRQRPARGGAGAARHGARGRPGHHRQARRVGHGVPDRHPGAVPGRPEHHPPADGDRRPRDRLAAAASGRGGCGRPGRRCVGQDRDFYTGKVAAAKWFAHNRLPLLTAEKVAALNTEMDLMDLPEGAF